MAAAAVATGCVAYGVLLRFLARSPLWLDEAQTVAIARAPLGHLGGALRQDGSPPLYYALLHVWIAVFGAGTTAVRTLSGVLSVAALVAAWWVGRRLAGGRAAAAAVLLLAVSPLAIRYATEARMYALLVLESILAVAAAQAVWRRPRLVNVGGLALATVALLLTHYWSFYLLAVAAAGFTVALLVPGHRRAAGAALAGLAFGCVLFLPWLPSFRYQLAHTGTPWAGSPTWHSALTFWGTWSSWRTTGGLMLAASTALLAVVGIARRASAAVLVAAGAATALVGAAAAALGNGAYGTRYLSVAYPVALLGTAVGAAILGRWSRRVLLAVACAGGLWAASGLPHQLRTGAGFVAQTLSQHGRPGDVVVYCPDQLAPAVHRLLPVGRYVEQTVPGNDPARLSWVDYTARVTSIDPAAAAGSALAGAGDHAIWLVYGSGYRGFGSSCGQLSAAITASRPGGQLIQEFQVYGGAEGDGLLYFPAASAQ